MRTAAACLAPVLVLAFTGPATGDVVTPDDEPSDYLRPATVQLAAAGGAACVNAQEYDALDTNAPGRWTRPITHEVFDFDGSQVTQSDGIEVRKYRRCNADGFRFVTYRWSDGRLGWSWYAVDKWTGF